jgi:ubiquinone/menaquinone biosynthesis C-methylase UbiE
VHGGSRHRVCPWWVGYLLLLPLRRLWHDPERILRPYVRPGMTVLEIGPGMGYFSLPLARMVGAAGEIVCVDVQQRMLDRLARRAARAGLDERITLIQARDDSLRIDAYSGRVDFTLAFAVVHEVADSAGLMAQLHRAMKPGARLLFSEPAGHVSQQDFAMSVETAAAAGFSVASTANVKRSQSVLLTKS